MALSVGSAPPSPRDRTDLHSVAPGTGVLFGLTFWGRLGSQLPRADGSPSQASAGAQGTPPEPGRGCSPLSLPGSFRLPLGLTWTPCSPAGLAAGASWPPAIPGGRLSAETPLLAGTAWGRRCTVRGVSVTAGRAGKTPGDSGPTSHVRELPPAPQPHLRSPGPYPAPVSLLRMLVPLGPRHL